MVEVIRALRRDHANLARLLDELERQIGILENGGEPDYDVIGCVVEYCLEYPDQCHHPKEDWIYRKLGDLDGTLAEPLGDLPAEHAALADQTRQVAEMIDQVLQEAEIAARQDPLYGERVEKRFAALRKFVLEPDDRPDIE